MAENSPAPDHRLEATDSSDYYDLLGVDRDANTELIERQARRLLAEHHPDKTSAGDSERFKAINRAQQVLTDPESRSAYDDLGHTEFVRRQDAGSIQLSQSDPETRTHAERASVEATSTTTSNGGTSRTETDSEPSEGSSTYGLITEVSLDLSLDEWLQQSYRRRWSGSVLGMAAMLVALMAVPETVIPPAKTLLVDTLGISGLGKGGIRAVLVSGAGLGPILLAAGWTAVITPVDDLPERDQGSESSTLESESGGQAIQDFDRGLNVAGDHTARTTEGPSGEAMSGHSRFSTSTAFGQPSDEQVENDAQSFRIGRRLLLVGSILTVVAAIATDSTPWVSVVQYLHRGDAQLIWGSSSAAVVEVLVILSGAYAIALFVTGVFGVLLTVHGASRARWHGYYLEENGRNPVIRDSILALTLSGFYTGLFFPEFQVPLGEPFLFGLPGASLYMISGNLTLLSLSILVLLALTITALLGADR